MSRHAFPVRSLLATAVFAGSAALAQTTALPKNLWVRAAPEETRPAELQGAQDTLSVLGQPLRLRAELWRREFPCDRMAGTTCRPAAAGGRVFIGPLWDDTPLAEPAIEQVWLLRGTEVWTTRELRVTERREVTFDGGPDWPLMSPVDVLVRLKGLEGLIEVRYRPLYRAGG